MAWAAAGGGVAVMLVILPSSMRMDLVFGGRGAGAVDDADVGEKDRGGVDFDVLEDVGGEPGGLGLIGVGVRAKARKWLQLARDVSA